MEWYNSLLLIEVSLISLVLFYNVLLLLLFVVVLISSVFLFFKKDLIKKWFKKLFEVLWKKLFEELLKWGILLLLAVVPILLALFYNVLPLLVLAVGLISAVPFFFKRNSSSSKPEPTIPDEVALISPIYLFYKKKLSYWQNRDVAYIEPTIPLGNLIPQEHFIEFLQRMYHKKNVDPFIGAYLFAAPCIVACNLDFIKDVLINDFKSFQERGLYTNEKDDPLSAHMFSMDGNKWRLLREKLSPNFTSGKMILMHPTMLKVTDKFNDVLSELVGNGKTIEMNELLGRFTTDIMGACVFGIECNSLEDPKADFRKYGRKVYDEPRHQFPVQIFVHMFPDAARWLGVKLNRDDVSDFFLKSVREIIEFREKNNVKCNDFMDLLIQLKNETLEGELAKELGKLSFEEVAAQAFLFFLAGFETSSTTMSFCLYELALNQDVQEKAREEIDRVLVKHGGLTYDAVMEITYVDQIISETLRKYPPLVNLMRKAVNDYKVSNSEHVIEKGMMVMIPVYSIHHDPHIYPNPEKFDPDRFAPEEIKTRHPMAFLGFGEGPRNCIGLRFGRLQARIALIRLLENYQFRTSPETPIPLEFSKVNPILTSVNGMYLEVKYSDSFSYWHELKNLVLEKVKAELKRRNEKL